ncbi:S49 family peptidase [Caballeronia sp. BR00000012568055]|uniref:S49 family peptidase n=1 Tax=Caballeronia sp. BR00000012568055 TaxID=2918761 RepID=UPI0023F6C636|nr:S49 family peptidase [Caballeronia sp. BR00000012568055]
MHPRFAFLAQRLFNVPLALHPAKAEILLAVLADRLGIASVRGVDGDMHAPGDTLADARHAANADMARAVAPVGYDVLAGVAVIPVQGTLVHRLGSLHPESGMTGYDGIRQNYLTALADNAVRAIVLDIDSPGGEVSGAFDLADAIYQTRGTKPVWAILSENAYSAAYAIASAADVITVPRTGGTGSIGVVWMHVDFSKALTDAGLAVTFVTWGARKLDGYPELPLSPAARERAQRDIDETGELFAATVARNRGLSIDSVRAMQAGTFAGAQGVAVCLADTVQAPYAAFASLLESLDA